jgi:pyruvate, water dikinase
MTCVRPFSTITLTDLPEVGGKNASLGELLGALSKLGIRVPDGFAITAGAYRRHLADRGLVSPIADLLQGIRKEDVDDLGRRATKIRNLILGAPLATDLIAEVTAAYRVLGDGVSVAVRSSATAEDLPGASFAGQQESFLHVVGEAALYDAVRRCFASLFTARAIAYRIDMGFDHMKVALSVGVQRMVRADRGASGVVFTLDTESGFRDVVLISSAWGLGENVVQGRVQPDEIYVHKPTLEMGARPILWKKVGSKEQRMVLDEAMHRVVNQPTPPEDRRRLSISDEDILTLARWSVAIEKHYSGRHGRPTPMDIEWAKDGADGPLYVVQARPETVHSGRSPTTMRLYRFRGTVAPIAQGIAVGEAIGVGRARIVPSAAQIGEVAAGDVLVTGTTDPDWEPVMKTAAAIVTERGGRTSHAAIIAREIGIPAIVGVESAMKKIPAGEIVTVSCAQGEQGRVYWGEQPFDVDEVQLRDLPATRTRIYMNLARPDRAFRLAQLPCDGVGLARMEFVLASWIGVHPMAIAHYAKVPPELRAAVDAKIDGRGDPVDFFVDRLSQGIGVLAAAFWPRPVILRFSDFKTNEYARLAGGLSYEPLEPNPMIGWRGASRYYDDAYRDGFILECLAIKRVRETMGLTNLQLMVPFCRTPEEAIRVFDVAAGAGLPRTAPGLAWYMMAEIPSNIFLADRFAELFDGFSIGSNDLTQLILGVDRDSRHVVRLFDERNEAVKRACVMLLETAHARGRTVGICGQAPSDYPDFAAYLVEQGIDSMSLAPDAIVPTRRRVAELEARH